MNSPTACLLFKFLLIPIYAIYRPISAQTIAQDSDIFGCVDIITKLEFDLAPSRLFGDSFVHYDAFLRNDSVMILPQAGTYKGAEAIKEYVSFIQTATSPYFKQDTMEDFSFQFKGLKKGLCEMMSYHRTDYLFNESTTAYAAQVGVSFMTKIFYDPKENYIPRIHVYYAKPWLAFFFGKMLNSQPTMQFLCRDVLEGSCGWNWPTCMDRFKALPALTPDGYADGDCVGCRALHGAFALTNPTNHCPHVSLTPAQDPNGKIKCHHSQNITVEDLFDAEDLEHYQKMSAEFGINGTMGYVENDPYYRTFRRVYEDTLLRTPPVSDLLQTLIFPGVAADALTNSNQVCPAFQNDTTYWTDFAAIELSETHLDYIQPRLSGDVVFGPGTCTVSYVAYKDIRKRLKEMPRRLAEGTAYRGNEVGKNRLNAKSFEPGLWSEGYVGQVMGIPNQDHDLIRPVLDTLFGDNTFGKMFADSGNRWSYSELVESASAFLKDKNRLHTGRDPSVWVLGMLQQIAFGKNPSEEAREAFINMRDVVVYMAFLPEDSVERLATAVGADVELALLWKRGTASNFEEILSTSPLLEEVREILGDDPIALKKASWALLDTFLLQGGMGVPNVILHSMAAYYNGFVGKGDLNVHDRTDLKLLILETIRRYPPVSSVQIIDARDHHRSLAFISATGYDESVYGDNVKDFRIRGDLQWYHERSMFFAEPALPVNEASPGTAHVCPGRNLAVALTAAWLEALDLEEWCVAAETPIKRIPMEFANFQLVRKGTEGASCWTNNLTATAGSSATSTRFGAVLLASFLVGLLVV